MKKIIKTALTEPQINLINTKGKVFDGVEVQLIGVDDNLALIDQIKIPVMSIHYYLTSYDGEKQDYTNPFKCEASIDLIIGDREEISRFLKVVEYAVKYNCPIVIHTAVPYRFIDKEKLVEFLSIIRKYDLKICLENVGRDYSIYQNDDDNLMLPVINSFKFNKIIGKEVFYPLLDICHLKGSLSKTSLSNKCLKNQVLLAIADYNSDNYYLHFCNRIGNGKGKNHGQNFKGYENEMHEYLNAIKNINKDATLVPEVYEDDHNTKPNSFELLKAINTQDAI